MRDPTGAFQAWLLHRVAEAVEGNEVSADLLTDLHAAIAEARAQPPDARDALALMDLAERVNLPLDHLTELLATLEAQPIEARKRFLRVAGPATGSVRGGAARRGRWLKS
jgi:hypothetical protein